MAPYGYPRYMTVRSSIFDDAAEFEASEKGYIATTSTFDAYVVLGSETLTVTVEVPTLDAAVVNETVPDVVEDGWYDTFQRRVRDVEGATTAGVTGPVLSRHEGTIAVETTIDMREGAAVSDALAVINFVEMTWFGGVIPGYEYEERVQNVREQASEVGGSDETTLNDGA